ncbi:MAG: hypothetical protein SVZ03_15545 [Spirochaetota bacterium]|nr:hypothetical protein [Spirochaetota bacterium]
MQKSSKFISIALIIGLINLSCTLKVYDTNMLLKDYKTDGFLDYDHYQVIINGFPNEKDVGLVERRESALANAKSQMHNVIITKLTNFILKYQFQQLKINSTKHVLNIGEVKDILYVKLLKYLDFGYIAFEYYDEDNSVVIVYRIFKDNLYKEIKSIKVQFHLKDEKGNQ